MGGDGLVESQDEALSRARKIILAGPGRHPVPGDQRPLDVRFLKPPRQHGFGEIHALFDFLVGSPAPSFSRLFPVFRFVAPGLLLFVAEALPVTSLGLALARRRIILGRILRSRFLISRAGLVALGVAVAAFGRFGFDLGIE